MAEEYEALRQRHMARYGELLPEMVQRLGWSRPQLEQVQGEGLRRIVAVARESSPWHRRRLADVDVDALNPSALAALPVMTKDDLMSNWDEIVTDRRLGLDLAERHLGAMSGDAYLLDAFHIVASGGSSGRRGVFAWDWDAWATAYASGVRWGIRYSLQHPLPAGRMPVLAWVAAEAPSHVTGAMTRTFANPLVVSHRFPVTLPLSEIVAGLNAVQPTVLMGYASILGELAHEALCGRLSIEPVVVGSASEPLLPEVRQAIERAWNAPVGNVWGTSEGCTTAASCYAGDGMHLSEDILIVEPVDAAGRPVQPGETSAKVYLTNLVNLALPLLRYEITDEVRVMTEPCPCGCVFSRVADIQGRVDDIFRYAGGVSIHPHVFRSPLGREPGVIEYQVRQLPRGAEIALRTGGAVDLAALRTAIATHLSDAGLEAPEIHLSEVAAIERTSAGKLKRFVPL